MARIQKDWKIKHHDQATVSKLAQELNISKFLATLLVNRNITTAEEGKRFIHVDHQLIHDPYLLKDMDKAVQTILDCVSKNKKICIYGDYDVDGAIGTSILYLFLKEIGCQVSYYIPNRISEGYSLNQTAIHSLKSQDIQLIITVDNGIMALDEVAYANSIGVDVVITDHHQVAKDLPKALAIINPQRQDCPYPFKGICGAGVAFKLIMALRQTLRSQGFFKPNQEPHLKKYLAWLAIATVCDVVPLVDENRYFVREGLKQLQFTPHIGLQELLKVCALDNRKIRSGDLGFKIGPRINACGRLDDACLGVRLLTTNDASEAEALAKRLNQLNQERRDIELDIVNEAFDAIETSPDYENNLSLVVFNSHWHEGVVGIVASRLVDRFGKPCFVLTKTENGLIKGSGRSIPKVSLISALRECSDFLVKFGGHEAAAGVTLQESDIDKFKQIFEQAVQKQIQPEELKQTVMVDEILDIDQVSEELFSDLNLLEPHGMSNARPVFVSLSNKIVSKRIVGEDHLKLSIQANDKQTLDAIAFRKGEEFHSIKDEAGLIFNLDKNSYNNKERIQLLVQEFINLETKPSK